MAQLLGDILRAVCLCTPTSGLCAGASSVAASGGSKPPRRTLSSAGERMVANDWAPHALAADCNAAAARAPPSALLAASLLRRPSSLTCRVSRSAALTDA